MWAEPGSGAGDGGSRGQRRVRSEATFQREPTTDHDDHERDRHEPLSATARGVSLDPHRATGFLVTHNAAAHRRASASVSSVRTH